MKCHTCPHKDKPEPCHQDFCHVWTGVANRVCDPNAAEPQQPKEKEVKGSIKMRVFAALGLWLVLVVFALLPSPAHSAAPPALDPGQWFVDANVMFQASVERLHETRTVADKQVKALDGATAMTVRTQCLTVSTEYNKRAAKVKPAGKAKRKAGRDADGAFNGYSPTEDFFEKRGLPRSLDARACQT